ncbi:16S rRNA (adenine(1518)-N(6)/adenine(1519)-N(6))-dimethyltransferase RsmA [Desulfobotulus sp. H1]|uniref:Ribosomal RNA small subunit methyltransferase A n=1 Tax=Desulfobotulus pelophilus TaxID=2823377 RepID=A0ABT3N6N5_9BACT|nr:16S rRNA (adenine(1518)-N(6)/adenine(1519)-N(6))-dimethyltransferase RsmA [Desulfobotulus pelophilus]MCW7753123.1 16S rRNA (adenine(1518)-N(6)/adenine(1519)-N(6))-dimethyltransferase RsmA [Desulfobotulus pelophilus]
MTAPQTLLKAWNMKPKKDMGQNFLTDPSTPIMILERAGIHDGCGQTIIEVGPGLGAMTIPAAQRADHVHAVELDREIIPLLETEIHVAGLRNITIHSGSILKVDLEPMLAEGRNTLVIGNLPYNISSQILIRLLSFRHRITRGVFMLQTEMAERIVAPPGGRDYGRLSVIMQYCGAIHLLATVKAHLFYPRPKVDSAIIEVLFPEKPSLQAKNEKILFDVVRAAFGQRRKTLRNSLSSGLRELNTKEAETLLLNADIDPIRRAETLSVAEFVRLADLFYDSIQ